MEANTTHSHAVARSLTPDRRSGLRGRFVALTSRSSRIGTVSSRDGRLDEAGARLERHLVRSEAVVLHHRVLPRGGGEIDHLIVGPRGVMVVDSSQYDAPKARVGRGGLRVGRRNRTDLIAAALERCYEVSELLAGTGYGDVRVEVALAWRNVEGLPILHAFDGPQILVCGTRKIASEVSRQPSLATPRVRALAAYLDGVLGG